VAGKLKAGAVESPARGDANKSHRKRTKSVEIELSRLKVLVEERPISAGHLIHKTEKKIEETSDNSIENIELTPMTLVIAANAILLDKYRNKSDEITPYEAKIDANLNDSVKIAMGGLLLDLEQILTNYKLEILELDKRHENRMELLKSIPEASQVFKKAVKKVLEVGSGIGIGALMLKIIYASAQSYIGHWPAVGAGAVAGGAVLFALSWKGADFFSKSLMYVERVRNYIDKKAISVYYSWKKARKLKMSARALQTAMGEVEGKEYELDYKVIRNIGRTIPSPFQQ